MADRWMIPLVEPPIDCSTTMALRIAPAVTISRGRGPPETAMAAARWPAASARRRRSAWTLGTAALPGSARPRASVIRAMVLAVPITMQVPAEGARRPLTASISAASILPARKLPQSRRQSVQAPSTSPL